MFKFRTMFSSRVLNFAIILKLRKSRKLVLAKISKNKVVKIRDSWILLFQVYVTREFGYNLCVKRDYNPPPPPLLPSQNPTTYKALQIYSTFVIGQLDCLVAELLKRSLFKCISEKWREKSTSWFSKNLKNLVISCGCFEDLLY